MQRAVLRRIADIYVKCPECGFDNLAELARCQQCNWQLALVTARATPEKTSARIIVLDRGPANSMNRGHGASGNGGEAAAGQDEAMMWRQEVSQRVRAYRSRRRQHIEGQEDFPFAHGNGVSPEPPVKRMAPPVPRPRRHESNRIELPVVQPMLAFEDADPQPVANLAPPAAATDRLRAGLLDLAIVLASGAGFFVMFAALGRELPLDKAGFAIYGLVLLLFFTSYLFLFTASGGRTPGMRLTRLELIRFDGGAPTFDDALWRTAGYLVSTGSFFLGFLWIFVDGRQLTWHDRISKTFIVAARPAPQSGEEFA